MAAERRFASEPRRAPRAGRRADGARHPPGARRGGGKRRAAAARRRGERLDAAARAHVEPAARARRPRRARAPRRPGWCRSRSPKAWCSRVSAALSGLVLGALDAARAAADVRRVAAALALDRHRRRAALFTAGLAGVIGVAFGAVAAYRPGRRLADALGASTRSTASASAGRGRGALVVAQVALAVVLLSAAGLLLSSVVEVVARAAGVRPRSRAHVQGRAGRAAVRDGAGADRLRVRSDRSPDRHTGRPDSRRNVAHSVRERARRERSRDRGTSARQRPGARRGPAPRLARLLPGAAAFRSSAGARSAPPTTAAPSGSR